MKYLLIGIGVLAFINVVLRGFADISIVSGIFRENRTNKTSDEEGIPDD